MKKIFLLSLLFALTGCGPEFEGEAVWTFKTSEIHKALRGCPARIRLREKAECPISNAYERVPFGGGRFTNQLDVIKNFVKGGNGLPLREFFGKDASSVGELTNDVVRLSVEENPGQLPTLKMEADVAVWLSQTNVLDRALCERQVDELVMYVIDPNDGSLKIAKADSYRHVNPRQLVYSSLAVNQYFLLTDLLGDEKTNGLAMASAYAALPAMPGYMKDHYYEIVGNSDEPLSIEAEDVVIDGRHHDTFKAVVKRGETLRMKINKKRDHGVVRFRLTTE